MPKKKLYVQPVRRIYQASYPSFQDKNPLLYPETRPYPFSRKFIAWASTGGLASLMLFSGSSLMAQETADSLYNPFTIERAHVPYRPVSFGTGQPERLKHQETLEAIRKAFTDSGIELKENVALDDNNISIYLNGYSEKEQIGFVLINYHNMDRSFLIQDEYTMMRLKEQKKLHINLDRDIKNYNDYRQSEFNSFLENKEEFIERINKYGSKKADSLFAEQLIKLETDSSNQALFYQYKLQFDLVKEKRYISKKNEFAQAISAHLNDRFNGALEEYLLRHRINSLTKNKEQEIQTKIVQTFNKIKKTASNKKFIKQYLTLDRFITYNSGGFYSLNSNSEYLALKLEIMNKYSLKEWLSYITILDEYQSQYFVSLDEAKELDKGNANKTRFIAPIYARDELTIIKNGFYFALPEDLQKKTTTLWKEYHEKNGMTDEIRNQKKEELIALTNEYSWAKIKDLPRQERDSLQALQQQKREAIKAKYAAMELLSEEEKAAFQVQFDALKETSNAWRQQRAKEIRQETMQALEQQVKLYIQWARSQMGH